MTGKGSGVPSQSLIMIAGATASGKTGLAVRLAEHIDAEIVNADSVQLYADLPVLSAIPTQAERAQIPHHLFGFVAADQPVNAQFWLEQLNFVMRQTAKPLILVGGTGLYLRAVIEGMAAIPPIDPAIKTKIASLEPAAIRQQLVQCDPQTANNLKPRDRQRNQRALEVYLSTGQPLAHWQAQPPVQILPPFARAGICLLPDRAALRKKITERMAAMLEGGALDEVRELRQQHADPLSLPIAKTHGLREILELIDGRMTVEEAVSSTSIRVGQYAKRQSTWFRHQIPDLSQLNQFGDTVDIAWLAHHLKAQF